MKEESDIPYRDITDPEILARKKTLREAAAPVPLTADMENANAVERARVEVQWEVVQYVMRKIADILNISAHVLINEIGEEAVIFITDGLSENFGEWFESLFSERRTVGEFYAAYYENPALAFEHFVRKCGSNTDEYLKRLAQRFLIKFGERLPVQTIERRTEGDILQNLPPADNGSSGQMHA